MRPDLSSTTLIVPVLVESDDRARNVETVLSYLNQTLRIRVIIKEVYSGTPKIDTTPYKNLDITHITEEFDGHFHRTRLLNDMLNMVTTPVVCNYDIDVLLPTESYVLSQYLLKNEFFEVVYPYGLGDFQVKIQTEFDRGNLEDLISTRSTDRPATTISRSEYGHCIFFTTESYKSIGGENENFVAYGPEDAERYNRCDKMGLRIHRIEDRVYHLEHSRTSFSNTSNVHFQSNQRLFESLSEMSPRDLSFSYSTEHYVTSRGFIIKDSGKNFQPTGEYKQEITLPYVVTPPHPEVCACGEPKNKVRYNFCQKCNRLY